MVFGVACKVFPVVINIIVILFIKLISFIIWQFQTIFQTNDFLINDHHTKHTKQKLGFKLGRNWQEEAILYPKIKQQPEIQYS